MITALVFPFFICVGDTLGSLFGSGFILFDGVFTIIIPVVIEELMSWNFRHFLYFLSSLKFGPPGRNRTHIRGVEIPCIIHYTTGSEFIGKSIDIGCMLFHMRHR
jgi:hypothetical protein